MRTLSPFDYETVIASVIKTGRAVIVHEAPRTCGFGAEISAQIMERAVLHLQAPVLRVTGFDTVPPLAKLEDYYQPDAETVVEAVRSASSRSGSSTAQRKRRRERGIRRVPGVRARAAGRCGPSSPTPSPTS